MIICKVSFFLVLVSQAYATKSVANIVHYTPFQESILCRSCGHEISTNKYIISKASPYSQYSFYDTIFHPKQDVQVQMLTDLLLFHFPIITLSESTCSGVGEWEESSWFPGFRSRPCICPECGVYIGFEYRPVAVDESEPFFGFVLTNIIGESCK